LHYWAAAEGEAEWHRRHHPSEGFPLKLGLRRHRNLSEHLFAENPWEDMKLAFSFYCLHYTRLAAGRLLSAQGKPGLLAPGGQFRFI
jgi:hypothetical protein